MTDRAVTRDRHSPTTTFRTQGAARSTASSGRRLRGVARTPPRLTTRSRPGHQCTGTETKSGRNTRARRFQRRAQAVANGAAPCWLTCSVRLEPEQGAYAGVPCWSGRTAWLAHVAAVFRTHYPTVRHQGDELSLEAFLAVCAAMSAPGRIDPATGRDARQAVATLATRAGVSESVVQRTRRYLSVLGLATEVLRGRQRTRDERMASWRVGDRARGWASVWALHPRRTQPDDPPVDNHPQVITLIQQTGTPSGNGPVGTSPSVKKLVSTRQRSRVAGTEDDAPHRATTSKLRKPGRTVPDGPGLALAKRWRAQPDCPGWARRFSAETWSRSLAAYAAHGWTERDLNQALRDVAAMGIRIYDDPRRPIPYLLMLLRRSNIEERPTIRLDAQAAEELAVARDRAAQAPQRRAQHHQDRQAAIAALSGPARAQVLAITAGAAQRAHRTRQREQERRHRWQGTAQ